MNESFGTAGGSTRVGVLEEWVIVSGHIGAEHPHGGKCIACPGCKEL